MSSKGKGTLKYYLVLWIGITAWLTYEYLLLNKKISGPSFLAHSGLGQWLRRDRKISPNPGEPLSFMLGWIGFSIICMTNLYILRQRLPSLKNLGVVRHWLDFHIFCGLMGPTFILFHTNLKIGGLVSISFWSMMISVASGVVGRYFYVQLMEERSELRHQVGRYELGFENWQAGNPKVFGNGVLDKMRQKVLQLAGVNQPLVQGAADPLSVFIACLIGDVRLAVASAPLARRLPRGSFKQLKRYALVKRKFLTLGYFERLMGHWRTFHFPFAVFMYVVSVIHIAAALIFRVNH